MCQNATNCLLKCGSRGPKNDVKQARRAKTRSQVGWLADKFLGVNVDVRIDVRYPIDAVSLSAGTAFANRANSM